jgi:hypothetical protein
MRERTAGAALAAVVVLAACVEKTETEKSETEKSETEKSEKEKSKIKVDITGGGNHGDPIPGVADTASFEDDTSLLRPQAVPVLAASRKWLGIPARRLATGELWQRAAGGASTQESWSQTRRAVAQTEALGPSPADILQRRLGGISSLLGLFGR